MRCKWHFRNSEPTENFSEIPSFRPKSTWTPPKGSASLEVFLGRVEDELFSIPSERNRNLNLSKEEWLAVKSLKEDKSIVIKPADKGSCVVVWDKQDYIMEAERQLSDESVYETISFNEKQLCTLTDTSNKLFQKLRGKGIIAEKELKYFTYEFNKAANLGKLYLLPKIHKRLQDVPGRPVISNCGTPTEKVSEFLDHHLQPVMKNGKSYIRDSADFMSKISDLGKIPEGSLLVTCDVVGLYPSIPHEDGLRLLEQRLNKRLDPKVPTTDLVKMAEFVLKNNVFEFGNKVLRQKSGTAIGTKFAPPYACIFMDEIENSFLNGEDQKPFMWLRYIDDIFMVWTHGREALEKFLDRLNNFHDTLKFTWEVSDCKVNFLDLVVSLEEGNLETDLYCKPTDCHQYLHYESCHPLHMKRSSVYSQALIKPADKGSCVVVWDKQDYIMEAERQLSDESVYETISFNEKQLCTLTDTSNKLFQKLRGKGIIAEKELKYFTYEFNKAANLGKLYLLPKIHKRLQDVPGRPVISNCGTPTEKVSEFLDHHLQPVMKNGKSYIRDSADFMSKISDLGKIPEGSLLVTCDVVGLYPSIPHEDGLRLLEQRLNKRLDPKVPTTDLVKMAEFVLKNNVFEFGNKVLRQKSGTAIGTKFAPPYACIFMDEIENSFLNGEDQKPFMWLRYIDDIFMVWTHGREALEKFLDRLNNFHDTLKFTWEVSDCKVNFLDLVVSLEEGNLETDLYCKPTDCHQYLHYESCHPLHMKRSSVYSQALRIKRICSKRSDCQKHLKALGGWFMDRGYPKSVVDTQIERVSRLTREEVLITKERDISTAVPFVVDYHPSLARFGATLRRLYEKLDTETKGVFPDCPFLAFRSPRNLRSHLVRAKIVSEDRREVGSKMCHSVKCETCLNIVNTTRFSSKHGEEEFLINHRLDCNSKNVVYLLSCKVCGIQYVGQTGPRFRFRWNNYKSCQRRAKNGQKCPQISFHKHFLQSDHNGLEADCEIRLIDKTNPHSPTTRESFWIETLNTLHPQGLNRNDE